MANGPARNRFTNIAAYVAAVQEQKNAPGRIVGGVFTIFHNGQWISRVEYKQNVPPPETLLIPCNYKGVNKNTISHNLK